MCVWEVGEYFSPIVATLNSPLNKSEIGFFFTSRFLSSFLLRKKTFDMASLDQHIVEGENGECFAAKSD